MKAFGPGLSKDQLTMHVRRKVRKPEIIEKEISSLLSLFARATDMKGVPLVDATKGNIGYFDSLHQMEQFSF